MHKRTLDGIALKYNEVKSSNVKKKNKSFPDKKSPPNDGEIR